MDDGRDDVSIDQIRASREPFAVFRPNGSAARASTEPDLKPPEMYPRVATEQDRINAALAKRVRRIERSFHTVIVGTPDKPGIYGMVQAQTEANARMERALGQLNIAFWLIAGALGTSAVALVVRVILDAVK